MAPGHSSPSSAPWPKGKNKYRTAGLILMEHIDGFFVEEVPSGPTASTWGLGEIDRYTEATAVDGDLSHCERASDGSARPEPHAAVVHDEGRDRSRSAAFTASSSLPSHFTLSNGSAPSHSRVSSDSSPRSPRNSIFETLRE
ncbi:hypothetical protein CORC01_02145 [Colletotrichum orchidophilum]|uniref:Uncharacterized protein n=1 Tax=Colletotrichum orchidophilum TaxID=1209926 RepID=A0A1G4BLV3_9PEZI|nr:uncharacterized protein CORC01_02145 [Colletotrichum orchidophilum]OHF02450.1 hypothetical protein CORC01_02145 [Colletotrichum orchidophilum]